MKINRIDDVYSATGQITTEQVQEVALAGYRAIICVRHDGEDDGQPDYHTIAEEADRHGLSVASIPVTGEVTPDNVDALRALMAKVPGPYLAYCRSGGRAGRLYDSLAG